MEKSKLMMIIIIALLVVLLGTVAAVSFYVMSMVKTQQADTPSDGGYISVDEAQPVKKLTHEQITKISLSPITTNLAVSPDGTTHIAKIGVGFGFDNTVEEESEAFATMISASDNLEYARAIVLACIYQYTFEELSDPEGMDTLANRIKERLQEEFNTTLIVEVYINERTLQ